MRVVEDAGHDTVDSQRRNRDTLLLLGRGNDAFDGSLIIHGIYQYANDVVFSSIDQAVTPLGQPAMWLTESTPGLFFFMWPSSWCTVELTRAVHRCVLWIGTSDIVMFTQL